MKRTLILLTFFSITWAGLSQPLQTVNAVLNDESYVAVFGNQPGSDADEKLRIRTHLYYVGSLLRNTSSDHLSYEQWMNRMKILGMLQQYNEAGNFPVNRDYPGERKPCFIDADGNICAVGYLIEQTKGREMAEAINAKYKYDLLLDMDEPAIAAWAEEFGLTLEECAMIQPVYGPLPDPGTSYADIRTGYGISSSFVGGSNIFITAANINGKWKNSKALSYIGLASGTGQIVMGLANIRRTTFSGEINGPGTYTSYRAQNNLSYVNIAAGTATLVSSILNLALQKKNAERKTTLGVYSFPNPANSVSLGLSFSRRI